MRSQLVTTTGLHEHPPQLGGTNKTHRARRAGLLDRAALHLGIALVRWGRRPAKPARERPEFNFEAERARQEAERLRDYAYSVTMSRFR